MSDTKKTSRCRAALLVSFELPDNFDKITLDLLTPQDRTNLFLQFLKEADDVHLGYGVQYAINDDRIKALREQNPDLTDDQLTQLADGIGYGQVVNDMLLLRTLGAVSCYRLNGNDDDQEPQG